MIIYHLGHYGLFSKCITHKITYHRYEDALFLLDEKLSSPSTREYIKKIKNRFEEKGIAKIITYNEDIFVDESSEELLKKKIVSFFDKFISCQKIEKVYSGFDTFNAFGVFLAVRGIRYSLIELSRGLYETDRYCQNNKKVYDELLRKYKCLSSDNSMVDKIFRMYHEDVKEGENKNIFIDYQKLEQSFDEKIKKDIFYCFDVEDISRLKGNYNLLVCSSYWVIFHLKKNYDDYFKVYHRILDMYADENCKLLIKPHPSAYFDIGRWENAHEGTIVVPPAFPSLYMHLFENIKVSEVIGTSSSGIELIYPDSKVMNLSLIHSFKYNEQMIDFYILYELSKWFGVNQFYVSGVDVGLLNTFFSSYRNEKIIFRGFNKSMIYEDALFYVNDINSQDASDLVIGLRDANVNALVLFSTLGKKVLVQLSEYINMLPCFIGIDISFIDLNKKKRGETIYLFCKSQKRRSQICQLMFTKFLYYSGETIVAIPHQWYEDSTLMKICGKKLEENYDLEKGEINESSSFSSN